MDIDNDINIWRILTLPATPEDYASLSLIQMITKHWHCIQASEQQGEGLLHY
jgi:hypothetical protein